MTAAIWARATYLNALTPDQRAAYLEKEKAARELEALDATPEVRLARQYIAADSLRGEHADRLLAFARDLARRRMN